MPLTRSKVLRVVKIAGVAIVITLIIAYAIWRSLNYARGPYIEVFGPANGSLATTSIISVRGRVVRANNISLNSRDLSMDEQGYFNEDLIVFPGLNMLTLVARDQFGRSSERQLQLVGMTEK